MYELTCPSCGTKLRLPFVRVGARAICQRCQHPYVIKPEQVVRRVVVRDLSAGERDPLVALVKAAATGAGVPGTAEAHAPPGIPAGTPAAAEGPPVHPAAGTAPVAPTAAQAPHPADGAPPAEAPGAAKPHPGAGPPEAGTDDAFAHPPPVVRPNPAAPVTRLIAMHVRQRQRRRQLAWLLALLALVVCGVLVALLVVLNSKRQPPSLPPGNPVVTTIKAQIDARPLAEPVWQMVDEPHFRYAHDGPILLTDAEMTQEPGAASYVYVGQVQARSRDLVIDESTLDIMLVDDKDRVYARASVELLPMMALDPDTRQTVRIPVTAELRTRYLGADWQTTVRQALPDATPLTGVKATPAGVGAETTLRVTADPLDRAVRRVILSIRAVSEPDGEIHAWRAEWSGNLRAMQTLELTVATPTDPAWTIKNWQVTGLAVK